MILFQELIKNSLILKTKSPAFKQDFFMELMTGISLLGFGYAERTCSISFVTKLQMSLLTQTPVLHLTKIKDLLVGKSFHWS